MIPDIAIPLDLKIKNENSEENKQNKKTKSRFLQFNTFENL